MSGEGLIVFGMDGLEPARIALDFALEEAAQRTARVLVVTAVQPPEYWALNSGVIVAPSKDQLERLVEAAGRATRETVAEAVRDAGSTAAAVPVETLVVRGNPAKVLLDQAAGADLLVVGPRGRGAIASACLDSEGQVAATGAGRPGAAGSPPSFCRSGDRYSVDFQRIGSRNIRSRITRYSPPTVGGEYLEESTRPRSTRIPAGKSRPAFPAANRTTAGFRRRRADQPPSRLLDLRSPGRRWRSPRGRGAPPRANLHRRPGRGEPSPDCPGRPASPRARPPRCFPASRTASATVSRGRPPGPLGPVAPVDPWTARRWRRIRPSALAHGAPSQPTLGGPLRCFLKREVEREIRAGSEIRPCRTR